MTENMNTNCKDNFPSSHRILYNLVQSVIYKLAQLQFPF
jgi:hypothetical protein